MLQARMVIFSSKTRAKTDKLDNKSVSEAIEIVGSRGNSDGFFAGTKSLSYILAQKLTKAC